MTWVSLGIGPRSRARTRGLHTYPYVFVNACALRQTPADTQTRKGPV